MYSQDKIKKLKDNMEMARLDTWSTFAPETNQIPDLS